MARPSILLKMQNRHVIKILVICEILESVNKSFYDIVGLQYVKLLYLILRKVSFNSNGFVLVHVMFVNNDAKY